ncbi:MAG: ribose 5-phosphate isomerase B [Spirochaetaceae bacterium]|jgi:ribose 5-phosphate isomerase B|nr:ribose 5-phosphate isomerase B [Spirochaetaceae bacterium]
MMIALASDHGGFLLKEEIKAFLAQSGYAFRDFGTDSTESTDYAKWGYRAARAVANGECEKALLFCGTGIGIGLTANKVEGVRCVMCSDCYSAKMSRAHNNANALALGGRVVGTGLAKLIVQTWLETEFEGGRHQRRIDQIMAIEQNMTIEQIMAIEGGKDSKESN